MQATTTSPARLPLDFPTETLAKVSIQTLNGRLVLDLATSSGKTKTHQFKTAEALDNYLFNRGDAAIWQLRNKDTKKTEYKYYAYGKLNTYTSRQALYQAIASGAGDTFGISQVIPKAKEPLFLTAKTQKIWFDKFYQHIPLEKALTKFMSQTNKTRLQTQLVSGLMFASGAAMKVSTSFLSTLPSLMYSQTSFPLSTSLWLGASLLMQSHFADALGPVGNEFQVNSYTTNHQLNRALAGLSNGGFVMTWQSDNQDGSSSGIYGKRYNVNGAEISLPTSGAGGAIGNEFPVNSYKNGPQSVARVTSLSDGGFVVIWRSNNQDGSEGGIYGKRYAQNGAAISLPTSGTGGAIGNEFPVNTYTNSYQLNPAITSLSDGGFVVTWSSYLQDGSLYGVYAKQYAANGAEVSMPTSGTAGAVGNEFRVNSYTTADQDYSAITALFNGGFVVTWHSNAQDGSSSGIYGKRYAANGAEVSVPTSGTGGAIGNEFPVNSYTNNNQIEPCITSLSDGGFVVTWTSANQDGSSNGIYGKRYAANGSEVSLSTSGTGGAVGNEFPVNSYTNNYQMYSAITSLSDGGFVVTWTSSGQDGSLQGVYSKRYAANGSEVSLPTSGTDGAVGNEFPVNSYTNDEQFYSGITSLSDGGFVVNWQSNAQDDGSSYGIYGKHYNSEGVEIPLGIASTGIATTGIASTGIATTGRATTGIATTGILTTGIASTGIATTGILTTGIASTGIATTGQSTTGKMNQEAATTGSWITRHSSSLLADSMGSVESLISKPESSSSGAKSEPGSNISLIAELVVGIACGIFSLIGTTLVIFRKRLFQKNQSDDISLGNYASSMPAERRNVEDGKNPYDDMRAAQEFNPYDDMRSAQEN